MIPAPAKDDHEYEMWDADMVCALLQLNGSTQAEMDELAPIDCSPHWPSKKERNARLKTALDGLSSDEWVREIGNEEWD